MFWTAKDSDRADPPCAEVWRIAKQRRIYLSFSGLPWPSSLLLGSAGGGTTVGGVVGGVAGAVLGDVLGDLAGDLGLPGDEVDCFELFV